MNAPDAIPLGLHKDMPAETYHADNSVSNTMLSNMSKSPAHCYALHLAPYRPVRAPTDAMLAGTLAHTAILEPKALDERYVVKPRGMRFSTREGMAWRDAQTRRVIGADEFEAAESQRAAVLRVPVMRELLGSGDAEISIFWHDEATGLRCRARTDWLHRTGANRAIALDVKTINDLTPKTAANAIAGYGYHRQGAHYSNGLRACGIEVEEFVFCFVSSTYPFLAVAYVLDDETKAQGQDEVSELMARYAHCAKHNDWPAFGDGYQLNGLPAWARRSSEIEVSYVD